MDFKKIPTFYTERLILREVKITDAGFYEKNFACYEVISELRSSVPWPYPEGGVLDYIKTVIIPNQGLDKWTWGIFLKSNPKEIIGCIDLWREGKPENRGFWLGKKYWGQGLMTEAVVPVMNYAFNDLGFEKLIFSNAKGNERSRRVKEKTNARLLRFEQAEYVNPDYTHQEVWELTKEDWFKS